MQLPGPRDSHTNAILDAVRRIVRALRQSSRQAEHDVGLSGAQLFVIQKLAAVDTALSLSELAERTLTHPSSVSVVVARLAERGFVARTPSSKDKRRTEVKLTPKGRAFLERAPLVTAQERLAAALLRLPEARRALLAELLSEVIADAGFATEEATMFFEDTDKPSP
jgi:DNA-binding MarR family transcriptional regulator